MGRADKVWLGLAIALVVVLAAGTGLLLYRRSQIVTAEQAAQAEATVTLAPMATSPVVPEPKPSPKPRSPHNPPAKDAQAGFITRVRQSDGGYVISFDKGKLESGEAAKADAIAQHTTTKNGWFVANQSHEIATYRLDPKCAIIVANPLGPTRSSRTVTHREFYDAFPGGDNESVLLQGAPYWIVLKGMRVVKIEQIQL